MTEQRQPDDLDALCPTCGERMGLHISMGCPDCGGTCPQDQPWWCWECANTGAGDYDPINDPPEMADDQCLCCATHDHSCDAELPPPCHPEARAVALDAGFSGAPPTGGE